jgi:hypothetical protein
MHVVFMQAVMADSNGRNIVRRLVSDSRSGFPAWPLFRSWPVLDAGFRNTVTACWRAAADDAARVAADIEQVLRSAEQRGATGRIALHVIRADARGSAVGPDDEVMRGLGQAIVEGADAAARASDKLHIHESESWRSWTKRAS